MTVEVEQEPPAASELFGDRIELARQFTDVLAQHGEERGLIGPLEPPRLWSRHVLNSVLAAPLFAGSVADIGSGGGLPGIVLAIARPDVQWTLIEPMDRRVTWLNEQVDALGLENVTVLRSRAEDVRPLFSYDQVTARAVSALKTLIPVTAPLVKDGGELILLKGRNVDAEVTAAQKQIKKFALTNVQTEELGVGVIEDTTRVFRATVRG